MNRSRLATSIDYSQQLAINLDELDKRERLNIYDVVSHGYLRRVLHQYESFGLRPDTLLFVTLAALGAISNRSFIKNSDKMPVPLNHGAVIVGKTGANKSSYIKLVRHAIKSLKHHFESTYNPDIDKNANKIDHDQVNTRQDQESSSTSSKMLKASFMMEVCTELAVTKNLATTDTFLCHDEGDIVLSTFGFYSPSDVKNAGGVNLMCSGLDGLIDYTRTTGHQCINVEDSHLSMLVATTGSKMSSTLQIMHQKKEDVGLLGRVHIWHLSTSLTFFPPQYSKIISDIASIDHLLVIGHELFQYSPEFRFQKHVSDVKTNSVINEEDDYMKSLRIKQGINNDKNSSNSSNDHNEHHHDIFEPCPDDLTDNGGVISAHKLMLSIINSEFQIAQQMDEHLVGYVRKATNKFPRICALLCLLEIIGEISSNLLKYIVFDEGNFSRPRSSSNKFISLEFVCAARQHVKNYVTNLPVIDGRPIIYINKLQVERASSFYTYIETTTKMLFDASLVKPTSQIVQETNSTHHLSKQEKQDITWMIKVLRTPVIFFSNNYLCKSIPGCPGSGVLKNASTELRVHILDVMKVYGLITSEDYLSSTKSHSFAKVPPSVVRQNESLVKLFTMFGSSLTLNTYEKLFETFSLVTTSDASFVPITHTGIKLLLENNAYVNYYHCLDKDERVLNMIQERINLKEICLTSYNKNGPYRYELIDANKKIIHISSEDVNDNYNERLDSDTQFTPVATTNGHIKQQQQLSSTNGIHEEEQQQSNESLSMNHVVDDNQKEIASNIVQDENPNDILISEACDHSEMPHQIQRQRSESSISINSRISSSDISFSSIDHHIPLQHLPLSSSPLPSILFQEALNINNSLTLNNMQIDDLSTILEEENASLSNIVVDNSDIQLEFISPVIETPQFTTQPFISTDVPIDATISNITCPDIAQPNDLLKCLTNSETNKSRSLRSNVVETISTNSVDPVDLTLPLFSTELQSKAHTSECRSSNTSPVCLSFGSAETSTDLLQNASSSSIVKKKRGRKSTIEKNRTSSPIDDSMDVENILANCKHTIYKRLILQHGIVFSKTDLTHAVQQFPNLRDRAIEKLVEKNIFIKQEVFAKRSSSGNVEYLDGYIKRSPVDNNDMSSNVEEYIRFANALASYEITCEEYIDSLNGKQTFLQDHNGNFIKHVLNRSHIKLSSYLFSSKFINFINNNDYFRERYTIEDNAICLEKPSMTPTASNIRIDEYQQMQYDQLKQHLTTNKRAYNQIKDNTGPAPKNSRRRP